MAGATVEQPAALQAPTPPFSLAEYPMRPVVAVSGGGWAKVLLGASGWTLDPTSGGVFDPADQSVSSVNPPNTPGLLTVLTEGPTQEVNCISYICVTGPGASTVNVAVYPPSLVGGADYMGWKGSTFEPGPAIETNGAYWYRLAVQWEQPFADPHAVFYAKTYRAKGPAQPFKLWAFKHDPSDRPSNMPDDGSLACLYQCAQPGPFLRAQLNSDAGRGILRVTYNWLYSALNCDPADGSPFLWDLIKLPNGQLALSPSQPYSGMKLYASVRPDWDYYVQVQAPRSADWIRAIGADEQLNAQAIGIIGAVFKGLNGVYIAVNQNPDNHGGHVGYRLRSIQGQLVDDCAFTISNATVLQPGMDFLEGYKITADDVRDVIDAFAVPGLTDAQIQQLVDLSPTVTPARLNEAHRRYLTGDSAEPEGWLAVAGAVVMGITWGVIGGILAGPPGAAAGIAAGIAIGAGLGSSIEPHEPHEDPTNTVNPANPTIARTLLRIQPRGGPYENRHLWEDLFRFSRFPQIGDAGLPDAGCVYPPATDNTMQLWYPTRLAVGASIHDDDKYPPVTAHDGTKLTMSLFVIVQLKGDGRFQLRCHPDMALLNRAQRPNHSQLTQGSRVLALMGDDSMHVYASGEMYVTYSGQIKGITAKTGHYFTWTATFDSDVITTTLAALQALGYSTSGILTGDDFWRWVNGSPWVDMPLGALATPEEAISPRPRRYQISDTP